MPAPSALAAGSVGPIYSEARRAGGIEIIDGCVRLPARRAPR
jgi:hypothetical protein